MRMNTAATSPPSSPGPHKESETRQRLLDAGLLLFGLHGLDAASTRALAREAKVNLAAIPYHFGGKEGLYRAVVEHVVRLKLAEISPCLSHVRAVCDAPATDRETLLELLRDVIRVLLTAMLESPRSCAGTQIMLQEQIAPTSAFAFIHDHFLRKIHAVVEALLQRLLGLPAGSPQLHLHAMAIMGQMFIFRVGMPSLLALMETDSLSKDHVAAIVTVCIRQAEALIAGFGPPRSGSTP